MKKCNLKPFRVCDKTIKMTADNEVLKLKEDRNLFACLLLLSKTRKEVNLQEVIGQYELSVVPRSMFAVDGSICYMVNLTLRTSEAGIPALRKLPCGVGSWYTGWTVCQRQASNADIPALFSNAYWHLNARVIEIQTRQQQKNNFFHETQWIFGNKFCIWTPSGQRTS